MTVSTAPEPKAEVSTWLVAALLATAPGRLGGACIRSRAGPAWEAWIAGLRELLPNDEAPVSLPSNTTAEQLVGGLDLSMTLATGRKVHQPGFIARNRGRPLVLAGAEPWTAAATANLISACESDAQYKLPLIIVREDPVDDASEDGAVSAPGALLDRLAFRFDLSDDVATNGDTAKLANRVEAARVRLPDVEVPESAMQALVACAADIGIRASRSDLLAVETARAHAAWRGACLVEDEDVRIAAQLVLAPRAVRLPQPDDAEESEPVAPDDRRPADPSEQHESLEPRGDHEEKSAAERLVETVKAALPPRLLASLASQGPETRKSGTAQGRSRGAKRRARHGRPVGCAPGDPRHDGPLDLLATVIAAAPWQPVRRRLGTIRATEPKRRLIVLPSDLRIKRLKHEAPSTVIFAVDASGSSALHRMGEAKGAVELLLGDCYARREKVALVAFQGQRAETVLPPTRALARARRALSGLPGGGPTPLASGLEAARIIAAGERRGGRDCLVVVLTDGRANIDLNGRADRKSASTDALAVARRIAGGRVRALVVDTSPAPSARAATLAEVMSARYVPLPHADAHRIAAAIGQARSQAPEMLTRGAGIGPP